MRRFSSSAKNVIGSMPKGNKVYAVRKGRKTGLFPTWGLCSAQVLGFKGAQYKSFPNEDQANAYLSGTSKGVAPSSSYTSKARFAPKPKTGPTKTTKGTILVYTDGSCRGNNNVAVTMPPAGWGFVALRQEGEDFDSCKTIHEGCGPVETESSEKDFLGAEVRSNNTGELCAIAHALNYLSENCAAEKDTTVVLRYDSKYAAKSTLGEFNGAKNRELILNCRKALQKAKQNFKVVFEHVKGHSNDTYNDIADRLANEGAAMCAVRDRQKRSRAPVSESSSNKRQKLDVVELD